MLCVFDLGFFLNLEKYSNIKVQKRFIKEGKVDIKGTTENTTKERGNSKLKNIKAETNKHQSTKM